MDEPNTYDIGDTVKVSVEFTDSSDPPQLMNPSTVLLKVRKPDGTETSSTPSNHDDVGKFSHEIAIDQDGEWVYRFEGTGGPDAASEQSFFVRVSRFYPHYTGRW